MVNTFRASTGAISNCDGDGDFEDDAGEDVHLVEVNNSLDTFADNNSNRCVLEVRLEFDFKNLWSQNLLVCSWNLF